MRGSWITSFCRINFSENFLRDVKRGVSRRNTTIDCALQQDFLDFLARDLVIERRAHVHAKFIATIQRDHHGKRQKAARVPWQGQGATRFRPTRNE